MYYYFQLLLFQNTQRKKITFPCQKTFNVKQNVICYSDNDDFRMNKPICYVTYVK